MYEDHELLVDNLMMWTRDSKNKLLFLERAEERTRLFMQPELFLLGKQEFVDFDDHARALLLEVGCSRSSRSSLARRCGPRGRGGACLLLGTLRCLSPSVLVLSGA